jgi:hypothetical protein
LSATNSGLRVSPAENESTLRSYGTALCSSASCTRHA